MPSPHARRIAHTLTAACTVLLTACASTTDTGNAIGEPDLGEIPVMLETKRLEFPLGAYEATSDERQKLKSAQDALVVQCMSRFGFAYTPPPQQAAPATDNRYIFGVVDAEEVARYGYLNPLATAAQRQRPPPACPVQHRATGPQRCR